MFSEVIKEVVKTFVPLGVKVFNLSVNDENRRWDDENKKVLPRNSWVARTIDFLSREHDVVFVISTGNIFRDNVRELIEGGKEYPKYLLEGGSRLLDPAQSALALTVGSIAQSVTLIGPNSAGDLAIANVDWLNLYGYGIPDRRRAVEADPYSALLYFQGTLKPEKVAFLSVPVPKELAYAEKGMKKMTVTVAFSPEVQRWGLERYFGAILKWRMFRGDIDQDAVVDAMSIEDEDDNSYRKTLDQELTFDPKINLRSKGAVQHASYVWTEHQEEYSQNHYTLALGSYERWGRPKGGDIPYAVAVRIEDLSQTCKVYSLVNAMIEVPV